LKITDLEGNVYPLFNAVERKSRVNGEKELSMIIHKTKQNNNFFNDIAHRWTIEFKGENYVIILLSKKTYGDNYYLEVNCIHEFYDKMRNTYQYETFTGSRTFYDILTFIFRNTGYQFNIVGTFPAEAFENFGDDFSLELFSKVLERYQAEFEVSGKIVTLKSKIGNLSNYQFRYQFNLSELEQEIDALDFSTYGEGFGKDGLHVVYRSPLADLYGDLPIAAYRNENYTIEVNLYNKVKQMVDDSLKMAITFPFVDMSKKGYPHSVPIVGDEVLLFEERLNLSLSTRIVELSEIYDENESVVNRDVTLSNFTNLEQQQSRINKANKALSEALEGRKPLPFDAIRNATLDSYLSAIDSAQTEILFENGLTMIDKDTPNNIMRLTSKGWYLSTDGGNTPRLAMSAEGLVADVITAGTINTNNIQIYGGNDNAYALLQNEIIETYGVYNRGWFGNVETIDSRITIGKGYVRLSKLNDELGARNLYLSNNGISTYLNGANSDEGYGSGVIEFWSHMFDSDRRGLTLYSNLGSIGLKTDSRDIHLDSNRDVNIMASNGRVIIRPKDDNRVGNNHFVFTVKNNDSTSETDGVIQYGSPGTNYASGIRFSKSSLDPTVYITNGNGDFGSGNLDAKVIKARDYLLGSVMAATDNVYAMVDNELRVTDKRGYNDGNINYQNIAARDVRANAIRTNGGTNFYIGVSGTNDGELRVTNNLLYNDGSPNYYPVKASEFRNASSITYKTNIETFEGNASAILNNLEVKRYLFKADVDSGLYHNEQIGFISELSPEIATVDMKAINVSKLLGYIVKAFQEKDEKINQLSNRLSELEEMVVS